MKKTKKAALKHSKHHAEHGKVMSKHPKKATKAKNKIKKVMKEYKEGKLHSGSKHGPEVKNPKQAIAIALSESRKVKKSAPKMKRKK